MDIEDIFLWADGTWCHRYSYEEYSWMSDDFRIISFDSEEYNKFMQEEVL